jgi:hypothetical protein
MIPLNNGKSKKLHSLTWVKNLLEEEGYDLLMLDSSVKVFSMVLCELLKREVASVEEKMLLRNLRDVPDKENYLIALQSKKESLYYLLEYIKDFNN